MADDNRTMRVHNYTSFWKLERKFYSFQDISLPVPISLMFVGIFALVMIPWGLMCYFLNIPLSNPFGFLFWFAVPIAVSYYGNKPIYEGRTPYEVLFSRIKYLLENKKYKRLEPDLNRYEEEQDLTHYVLSKNGLKSTPLEHNPYSER